MLPYHEERNSFPDQLAFQVTSNCPMATQSFSAWILEILQERGWSQAELSKRCAISPAQISRIISGSRQAGLLVCLNIAKGLNFPVDVVYQKAGFLPEDQAQDASFEELKRLYQSLRESDRVELLVIARHRAERTKKG